VAHDGTGCIVKLIILNVEICELLPVLLLITNPNELGDVKTGGKELDVLHKLLRTVLGIQDTKFSKDSHVSPFQTKATFHERDQLIEASSVLVIVANLFQIINLTNSTCKQKNKL
jgi:hypothetical protein